MIARVPRLPALSRAAAEWSAPPWRSVPALRLANHMGDRPAHFPTTSLKIAYDDRAVHVIFRVADRYVRAVAAAHQEPVCRDSCVEFFFTPGTDVAAGYFNLEMNCGGTLLFHFNPRPREGSPVVPPSDCEGIVTAHSLPRIVDPEIREPVTWTVACTVPVALLARHAPVRPPGPGAVWRANFYKCADDTSHPHWLTWAPVTHPRPDFHRPQAFGVLEFE